ncbi:hypothetical protein LGV61_12860 [Desulfurispirillum indicum]|uniref:Outer membrane protein beta-barrel domain-containing protein n=1 Tax=Desulfurispirillum indicum (strain ATCC BAA-1389 / DSM 22839 / S5) TaxID=653733 RepID=E6W5W6_DESIS|nr:hypothetical protein [Desulfurispirillum indicum]ADU67251.1 hypothetical protein Selin_2539 [Desulfurispirillum indicum S5]UCZ56601.1 hypothetical protein LGV61_12860 [Desulfurispirillum indicum]
MKIAHCTRFSVLALFLLALTWMLMIPSSAAAGRIAAGFALGEITGLSIKYWQDNERAFDFAAGWSDTETKVKLDYLFHEHGVIQVKEGRVFVYYGLGLYGHSDDDEPDDVFGIRVPFGIEYFIPNMPLSIYGDIAPAMDLNPETDFSGQVMLGARFIF